MQMTKTDPGASPDNPLYFKFLRDGNDDLNWGKVAVALAVTVLSGYLATQSQRAGSGPDQLKAAKMRLYRMVGQVARGQVQFWGQIESNAHTRYDIARL